MIVVPAAAAHADLRDDASRLAAGWGARGQEVVRGPTVFIEHAHSRLVPIEPHGVGAPLAPTASGCTTVALLGARTAEFRVDIERPLVATLEQPEDDERRVKSVSGAAVLTRCGAEQAELRRVLIELSSPRAAIEVLIAHGDAAPGPVEETLIERAPGPFAGHGDAGAAIDPGSPRRSSRAPKLAPKAVRRTSRRRT